MRSKKTPTYPLVPEKAPKVPKVVAIFREPTTEQEWKDVKTSVIAQSKMLVKEIENAQKKATNKRPTKNAKA